MNDKLPHVLIIGAGFGGLWAAKHLSGAPVRITLLDQTNHHLFQPLLYQVALAELSPADIAYPIRSILRRQANVTIHLDKALAVDLANSVVTTAHTKINYDYLVLATGARNNYFGHDNWAKYAPGLKNLQDALSIRSKVLEAFEEAEQLNNPSEVKALLTFVVIGGGPTGVELAGSLAEMAKKSIISDFRHIDPEYSRIILLEGADRVLTPFPPELSVKAEEQLKALGVQVRTKAMVKDITADGVYLNDDFIAARTVLWCAGVQASEINKSLGVPLDKSGRVIVDKDLSIAGHPNIFVIGDAAAFSHQTGHPLPGLAPVAMQEGTFVAQSIKATISGKPRSQFHYTDKGTLATIGRNAGIADIGKIKLSGPIAWFAWLLIHILFLIGFRNKLVVMLSWMWSYITYERSARLLIDYTGDDYKDTSAGTNSVVGNQNATHKEP